MLNKRYIIPGGLDLSGVPSFRGAHGARVIDAAGKSYVDLISGYGTVIAGHANEAIVEDVIRTLYSGNYLYGHHELISRVEQRLIALFPTAATALFFKTGSEAVQCATRLVRAATGRERILRCGFHGWHDQFMTENVDWHEFGKDPVSKGSVAGVPMALASAVTRVTCDEQSLAPELRKGDVAALIFDPVQLSPPYRERLEVIQKLCRAHGALLIIDESKTGFRVSPAGVQGLVDLYGDVTILSKAIANGFPLAAVLVSDDVYARSHGAKIMGTYNNELSALAAASATLDLLLKTQVWQQLNRTGDWLLKHVNEGLAGRGCHMFLLVGFRWPSMPVLIHTADNARRSSRELLKVVAQRLLRRRILWLPHHMNFLSLAHDGSSLDEFADALISICMEVQSEQSTVSK